jgi:hypothetical protein
MIQGHADRGAELNACPDRSASTPAPVEMLNALNTWLFFALARFWLHLGVLRISPHQHNGSDPMIIRTIALSAAILLLQGCAAVALTAGGIAAATGVNHTLSGIAYKTVIAPVPNLRLATLKTLNRMEVDIRRDEETTDGWLIAGDAHDRDINIQLERLTPTTTRMRVTVNRKYKLIKDQATATEIIAQSVMRLEEDPQIAQRAGQE